MTSLPTFPTAENGYDPSVVDAFVVRLVEKARSEMADLRRYVSELESALERVAVEQWEPEPLSPLDDDFVVDAPIESVVLDPAAARIGAAEATDPDEGAMSDDVSGEEEFATEDDPEQSEDDSDRIAALVDRRIRGRRMSAVTRPDR